MTTTKTLRSLFSWCASSAFLPSFCGEAMPVCEHKTSHNHSKCSSTDARMWGEEERGHSQVLWLIHEMWYTLKVYSQYQNYVLIGIAGTKCRSFPVTFQENLIYFKIHIQCKCVHKINVRILWHARRVVFPQIHAPTATAGEALELLRGSHRPPSMLPRKQCMFGMTWVLS